VRAGSAARAGSAIQSELGRRGRVPATQGVLSAGESATVAYLIAQPQLLDLGDLHFRHFVHAGFTRFDLDDVAG
jgi:hypothetical protein